MIHTIDGKVDRFFAVYSLVGGQITTDDGVLRYDDGQTPPTEEAIQAEMDRLQAEYDSQEYARNRILEYPPIIDQLDMQFHDWNTWKDTIQAVKDKYPKG